MQQTSLAIPQHLSPLVWQIFLSTLANMPSSIPSTPQNAYARVPGPSAQGYLDPASDANLFAPKCLCPALFPFSFPLSLYNLNISLYSVYIMGLHFGGFPGSGLQGLQFRFEARGSMLRCTKGYRSPSVDRIWLWVYYNEIPICHIFNLLKWDYTD